MTQLTFTQLSLSPETLNAVAQAGFVEPTPIQTAAISVMLEGKDAVLQAQTGTGKTAAFALPIIEKIEIIPGKIQALILVPTRELANQVSVEISRLGTGKNVLSTAIYGGVSFEKQLEDLKKVEVVVATPGRLLDLRKQKKISFKNVSFFGLDEADEMLSMGFEEDVMDIALQLPRTKQCFLCSATFNPSVQRMSSNFMRKPEVLNVSSDEIGARNIDHFYFKIPSGAKPEALRRLILDRDLKGALIFANRRVTTFRIYELLKEEGYKVGVINGELHQKEREKALQQMKENQTDFLVATDIAARGIDISGLPAVINYDMPKAADIYIHRTGRTGRAGQFGIAYSLLSPEDIAVFHRLIVIFKLHLEEKTLPNRQDLLQRQADYSMKSVLEFLDVDQNLGYAEQIPFAKRLLETKDIRTIAKLIAHFSVSNRNGAPSVPELQDQIPNETENPKFALLKCNLGREDFSSSSELLEMLVNVSGIELDDLGEAFPDGDGSAVEVRFHYWRSLIKAVEGSTFGDKIVKIERIK